MQVEGPEPEQTINDLTGSALYGGSFAKQALNDLTELCFGCILGYTAASKKPLQSFRYDVPKPQSSGNH